MNIALVGNPNTGKTTVFNGLTGLKQKIGNYPGITVERKIGFAEIGGTKHTIIDLPGTYSLHSQKLDERVTRETLTGQFEHEDKPDLVLIIVDASNLDRNLFLATQVLDLGIPAILVLNMMDVAKAKGIGIDSAELQKKLGIPLVSISAKNKNGIDHVKETIQKSRLTPPKEIQWDPDPVLKKAVDFVINDWIKPHTKLPRTAYFLEALRLISKAEEAPKNNQPIDNTIRRAHDIIIRAGKNPAALEVMNRYDYISSCTNSVIERINESNITTTDRIDAVTTHKIFGPIIFLMLLLLMFQAIFSWATPFMDMIDLLFINTGNWLSTNLPEGMLSDLLVEGVVAGLGGVIIFLPQIVFLFFFISILEGSGYMARAAFIMDGYMSKIGLHGRSVVPLISGFACAIPGIMATRNIENWRDRIITMMILPFMSCSARLPVYALLIAAFIPQTPVIGFIDLQGVTFFGLYFFGIVIAALSALVMNKFLIKGRKSPFIMELPDYKMPKWSSVFQSVFDRGRVFVTEAGRIIIAISIILWFLASFPKTEIPDHVNISENVTETSFSPQIDEEAYQLKNSYAGKFGHFIEPAIEPLGFDWKIGIGLITSFAAREVMVGTLNTIYSIEGGAGEVTTLKQKLVNDVDYETGKPVYSTATALSLMVFFALAMQCMSTLAIVRRETNSWTWPIIMLVYMTGLAYISSFITYQIALLF
ncbi:ferrous iron transport protein B [Gracilimonas sp. Q87]|uniref:ferrous iron transport protein B n=1 Tax=Gracilimonas sp. Q87 TaxID=3384766 RepID=UPI00398456BC